MVKVQGTFSNANLSQTENGAKTLIVDEGNDLIHDQFAGRASKPSLYPFLPPEQAQLNQYSLKKSYDCAMKIAHQVLQKMRFDLVLGSSNRYQNRVETDDCVVAANAI